MDKLLVQGEQTLRGDIDISGAKNSALPILAACLLTDQAITITNMPYLHDITTTMSLLAGMGASLTFGERGDIKVHCDQVHEFIAPYELVCTMRASILVLGPLLARFGQARVSLPGGCAIGARPVDIHLNGLQAMGAEIRFVNGYIEAQAPKGLHGTHLVLDKVTVNGTQNLMMAACLAQGETIIDNVACEPEVIDLANFLNYLGAKIQGAGTTRITITGVKKLGGGEYHLIPDRIEAGTYLIATAMTQGYIRLNQIRADLLDAVLQKLTEAGAHITTGDNFIELDMLNRSLKAVDITTAPYPGIPTDIQAQFLAMNTIAQGSSVVTETIFENRFMHVQELVRMGADIKLQSNSALIKGVMQLSGAPVMATDLRASACLILASLVAKGETMIDRVYYIDRGYERIEEKLSRLGAAVKRITG